MHPIPGDVVDCGFSEVLTLFERWAEEAGGTYVASIFGEPWVFVADLEEVKHTAPHRKCQPTSVSMTSSVQTKSPRKTSPFAHTLFLGWCCDSVATQ
jgi:hypothetical protein